jgi:hypothetical protein
MSNNSASSRSCEVHQSMCSSAYGLKVYAVDHQLAHTLSGIMGRISEIELRLFDNNNEFRENVSMNEMMDTNSRRQLIKDVEYMRETTDSVDWSSVPDPWSDIDKPIKNLNTFYHLTLVITRSDAGFTVKAGENQKMFANRSFIWYESMHGYGCACVLMFNCDA